jgi:ABC-2 type transport system permease protein
VTDFLRGVQAIAVKEALHIARDRLTLALLISVPLVQLLLFGFAIDLHPKNLPTALLAHEDDGLVRRAVEELETIGYFKIVARTSDPAEAERWLAASRVQFILALPEGFSRCAVTGARPQIRLVADATDPVASIVATQAAEARYAQSAVRHSLPVRLAVELRYNPAGTSRLFVVPGLLGVVLTLTLTLVAALTLVRERERGTYELLLLLPIPRSAILLGKLLPYFVLGFGLFGVLIAACGLLLQLPWPPISAAFLSVVAVFVVANLGLGIVLSLCARNQMQAMQLAIFFYLPSMLLSGFMFPFHGMPVWARTLGEMLPLTHFLRVIRGVLLKQLPAEAIWPISWPIALFAALASLLALVLFRRHE